MDAIASGPGARETHGKATHPGPGQEKVAIVPCVLNGAAFQRMGMVDAKWPGNGSWLPPLSFHGWQRLNLAGTGVGWIIRRLVYHLQGSVDKNTYGLVAISTGALVICIIKIGGGNCLRRHAGNRPAR